MLDVRKETMDFPQKSQESLLNERKFSGFCFFLIKSNTYIGVEITEIGIFIWKTMVESPLKLVTEKIYGKEYQGMQKIFAIFTILDLQFSQFHILSD